MTSRTESAFLGSEPCIMTIGFRLRADSFTRSYFPCHHLGQFSSKAAEKAPKLAHQGHWNDLVPRVPVVQIEFFPCLGGTASVHFAICGFSMTSYAESTFWSLISSDVSVGLGVQDDCWTWSYPSCEKNRLIFVSRRPKCFQNRFPRWSK